MKRKALTFTLCFTIVLALPSTAQTVNANSVVFLDPTLGANADQTALFRTDPTGDYTRLRLQMGDEETSMFEMGYPFYATGQWTNIFTLDGSGNGYFRGNVSVNGNLVVPGNGGNRQIYTWDASDANWRIGMSVTTGFTKSLVSSHSQYITYHNAPGQGFAVGVNGAYSSFEIAGSNHQAFFRGNVGLGNYDAQARLSLRQTTATQGLVINNCDVVGNQSHLAFTTADQPKLGAASESYLNVYNDGKWNFNSSKTSSGITMPLALSIDGSSKLFIKTDGFVGIGTTSPTHMLTVNGKVKSEEVEVVVDVAPDYVFEPTYHLAPLEDVKRYIAQHKHLPEVPSAKEMEKDGVKVGEMEMILLKKIEELTLYMIELKQENSEMKKELEHIKSSAKN